MNHCSTENCSRVILARTLCQLHWQRWYRSTEAGKKKDARYNNSLHGKLVNREKTARYRQRYPDRVKASKSKYRSNPEAKEKERTYCREYNASDAGKRRFKRYLESDKGKAYRKAATKRYFERLDRATPSWADKKALKDFYQNCPKGFSVDHIIPLNGETVSGLHVISNLQYLPRSENSRKRNSFKD
jgi:hypothetical protein